MGGKTGCAMKLRPVLPPHAWRRLAWALLAGAALLGLTIWAAGSLGLTQLQPDEAWQRIQARRLITVATDASYPPFSALDENGEFFGFEIDLAEAIAARWGVSVAFENITYDALLPALVARRDDMVISAFVPQPERLKEVSFSRAYFVAGTVAVIRADGGRRLGTSRPDAWASGQVLAVESGSGGDALARQWARRVSGITLLPCATAQDALQAVVDNRAEAALTDAASTYAFLRDQPALALAGPPLEPEPYAIAVSSRSHELFGQVEQALAALEGDGSLPSLRAKWFGEAAR